MIEVLEELDRALCVARTKPDQVPNDDLAHGDRESRLDELPHDPTDPLSNIHQRVLAALNCETVSQASYVARAELALYLSVDNTDPDTRLIDLLCHLRHWADANQADFESASRDAEQHHSVERQDPYAMEAALGGREKPRQAPFSPAVR